MSRAAVLWERLGGMYGVDSLMRKFGESPPMEWVSALSAMNDAQMQNGLQQLAKAGSAHLPTLPEFLKACRESREFASPIPQVTDSRFDPWDIAANHHFLAYLRRCWANGRTFTAPETQVLVTWKNAWARDCREDAVRTLEVPHGSMPVEEQMARWRDCMVRAWAQIGTPEPR